MRTVSKITTVLRPYPIPKPNPIHTANSVINDRIRYYRRPLKSALRRPPLSTLLLPVLSPLPPILVL